MAKKFKAVLLFGAPGPARARKVKCSANCRVWCTWRWAMCSVCSTAAASWARSFLQYSTKGELVPDDFTVRLWKEHIDKLIQNGKFNPENDLLVLDGIPRNANQAKILDQYIEVAKLVSLRCDHDVNSIVGRMKARALKQNRPDDANEQIIRRRFEVYDKETKPVLAHYPDRVKVDVDALQMPLEVAHDVISAILGRVKELRAIKPSAPAGKR